MPLITMSKRSAVEPFHAMDILAEANRRRQAGRPVISMAVGQPSHPAPKASLAAAQEALKHGRIGYTDALGLRELREAIQAEIDAGNGEALLQLCKELDADERAFEMCDALIARAARRE